jgi:hypothetical protein
LPSISYEGLAKGIADTLQGMDPRTWLQSIMHGLLGARITFIVCLVIFCIGYFCLQQQLKSFETSEGTVMLGLLRLKSKKGGIVGASSGTLPV